MLPERGCLHAETDGLVSGGNDGMGEECSKEGK